MDKVRHEELMAMAEETLETMQRVTRQLRLLEEELDAQPETGDMAEQVKRSIRSHVEMSTDDDHSWMGNRGNTTMADVVKELRECGDADEWKRGWVLWCRLGNDDELEGPALAGYQYAAERNDHGGGERPLCADADDEYSCWCDEQEEN